MAKFRGPHPCLLAHTDTKHPEGKNKKPTLGQATDAVFLLEAANYYFLGTNQGVIIFLDGESFLRFCEEQHSYPLQFTRRL